MLANRVDWVDIDQLYKFLGIYSGETVKFTLKTNPSNITLPNGFITWGGVTSGTAQEVDVAFSTVGNFGVQATIGNKILNAIVEVKDVPSGLGEVEYALLHQVYSAIAYSQNLITQNYFFPDDSSTSTLEPFIWAASAYPGGQHNTIADAARHSYWNCLLARYTNAGYALGLTTAHEKSGAGAHTETVMDLNNNLIGISEEGSHTHTTGSLDCCRQVIQAAISRGTLWYLDRSHGVENSDEDAMLQPTNK
jgi:hypothetical protein